MKYTSSNKPLVCMQTQSTCYKGTEKMTPKGVLWHSTAANNPTIKRYVQPSDVKPTEDTYSKAKWLEVLGTNKNKNDWNHKKRQVGLNCWIGKLADGTVTTVQTMPWNFKPWGCGKGKKGTCNDGWIQFEICEDNLKNKDYFNAVYKEGCEITAYLCNLYNIDPNGTVTVNGVKIPTILCHKDSYKLGFGSNHGDVLHWFKKYNKTMDDVRKDVTAILEAYAKEKEASVKKVYRVRKSWKNAASQKGAFSDLKNAKDCCQKAGEGYKVYDWNGNEVYAYVAAKTIVEEKHEEQPVVVVPETLVTPEVKPVEPEVQPVEPPQPEIPEEPKVEPEAIPVVPEAPEEIPETEIEPEVPVIESEEDPEAPEKQEESEESESKEDEQEEETLDISKVNFILGLLEKVLSALITFFSKK